MHPLADLLVSREGRGPLGELPERETQIHREAVLAAHGTQASACVRLLDHFNHRTAAVAEHRRSCVPDSRHHRPEATAVISPRTRGYARPLSKNAQAGIPVQLKVTIAITDELDDEVIQSTGSLDLASGEIFNVVYQGYDVIARGLPAAAPDYAFTSGTLSHAGKDVEFGVKVDRFGGHYSVSPDELLDIKVRAAKLFAGIDGKSLATGAPGPRDVH